MASCRPVRPCTRFSFALLALAVVSTSAACGDDDAAPADGGTDAGPPDAGPIDAGPPWTAADLPPLEDLGEVRGRRLARSIVHLHSPLSHDACDGEGWVDGALADATCLANLRAALCTLKIDAAMLTDHAPHVNEVAIADGLWMEAGDQPVTNAAGDVIGSRMACADGHRVLVTVGSENALMPVALERHVLDTTDLAALEAAYDESTPAAVDAFRAAGALVMVAHSEGRAIDSFRMLLPDGMEIYNTHANLAPDIREEDLGLEPLGYLTDLLEFTDGRNRLPPDLMWLSFFVENQNALDKWDTLLAEGARLTGFAGNDAHENTFPEPMADGERGDSFRRLMRWSSNHLLVDDLELASVRDALATGRLYVVFEIFGTPVGFDFVADDAGMAREMGEDAIVGATLRVVRPVVATGQPGSDAPPPMRLRILRSTATGAVEVASGDGAMLEHVATEPGPYRAEVRITPDHMRPYLGRFADRFVREHVWIYSNPIFVGAAP